MNTLMEDIDEMYYDKSLIDDDNIDLTDDIEDDKLTYDNFYNRVIDELQLIEVDRQYFSFKYKDEYITARPIHKLDNKNIIFDVNKKLKKINLDLVELE